MQALAAGDRDRFLAAEAEARRQAGLPPFGRLAALIVAAEASEAADFAAGALARSAPHFPGVTVLGPAPAPLAVLRGRHRRRFLVKTGREVNLQAAAARLAVARPRRRRGAPPGQHRPADSFT